MKTFNTQYDVNTWVNDQIQNFDMSQYIYEFGELVDLYSHDLIELLRKKYNWEFGEELLDLTQDDWEKVFHNPQYEK